MQRRARFFSSLMLTVTIVAGSFAPFAVPVVHADDTANSAISGAAGCAVGALIAARLSALLGGQEVPTAENADRLKEQAFDCVAWVFANIVLEQMTAQVINWANSGFDGNPAFVDDPVDFLKDSANEVTGAFITANDLEFLCDPFQVQIQLSILQAARSGFVDRANCTITDVVENIDGFIEGDFNEGGWKGWFELTQRSGNNPFGAYFQTNQELNRRIDEATEKKEKQLEYGEGFRTTESCEEYEINDDGTQGKCLKVITDTPGTINKDQTNDALTSSRRRIEFSDELNEVIGSLFAQLILKALTREGGLRGIDPAEVGDSSLPDIDPIIDAVGNPGGGGGFDVSCTPGIGEPGAGPKSVEFAGPWSPPLDGGDIRFNPGLTDGHYTKATIDFDFYVDGLLPEEERPFVNNHYRSQPFVVVRHIGDAFNGWFIYTEAVEEYTGFGGVGNSLGRVPGQPRQFPPLVEGRTYHVNIEYDVENPNINDRGIMTITDKNTGAEVMTIRARMANSFFPVNGQSPRLILDVARIQNTYNASHIGAVYSNLEATFYPGEPVCNPRTDGGSTGNTGNTGSGGLSDQEIACLGCDEFDDPDDRDSCREVNSCDL